MNGKERLLKTLRGEPVDRVSSAPFLYYNNVYEMFGCKPDLETFFDPPDFDPIAKFVAYCDHFGFDVLYALPSAWDFHAAYNSTHDQSFALTWDDWDVAISDSRKGDQKHRRVTVQTPRGEITWAEEYRSTSTYLAVSAPVEYPIKGRDDFEVIRKYAPSYGKPVREDIEESGQMVGIDFVLNVILDGARHIIEAAAGDARAAHREGGSRLEASGQCAGDPAGGPGDRQCGRISQGYQPVPGAEGPGQRPQDCSRRGIILLVAAYSEGLRNPVFEAWTTSGASSLWKGTRQRRSPWL